MNVQEAIKKCLDDFAEGMEWCRSEGEEKDVIDSGYQFINSVVDRHGEDVNTYRAYFEERVKFHKEKR